MAVSRAITLGMAIFLWRDLLIVDNPPDTIFNVTM